MWESQVVSKCFRRPVVGVVHDREWRGRFRGDVWLSVNVDGDGALLVVQPP